MQNTHTTNDTRPETSRRARWTTLAAVILALASPALGAIQKRRPAPPPPPQAQAAPAPRRPAAPVVAPAQAPEPPDDEDAQEPPEPPEMAEAPEPPDADWDFDMPDMQFDMPDMPDVQIEVPDVNVMPDVHVVVPRMPMRIWRAGEGFDWRQRQHFDDVENEKDPARRTYLEGRNFAADSEWEKAAAKFNEVVTKYSTSKVIDAALYYYALSLKKQGKYEDGYTAANRLVAEYPKSRWADDGKKLLVELSQLTGRPLPQGVQEEEQWALKLYALRGIFESKPAQGVQISREYFKPGSTAPTSFKQQVVVMLAQVDDPAAIDLLLDIVRTEADAKVRRQSIMMLGQRLDDKQRGDQIFNDLKGLAASSDPEVAKLAIIALSRDDGPRSLQFLIDVATSAQVPAVQKQAIMMLGQRSEPAALDALIRIYDTAKDPENRKLALVMLAQNDSPKANEKLMDVALNGGTVEIRRFALIQLAQRDPVKATQVLVRMYDTEKNETLKEGIIDGLGQIINETNNKEALHKLMKIAKDDPSIQMRKKAVFWIGRSKDPEATQFLVDLLK